MMKGDGTEWNIEMEVGLHRSPQGYPHLLRPATFHARICDWLPLRVAEEHRQVCLDPRHDRRSCSVYSRRLRNSHPHRPQRPQQRVSVRVVFITPFDYMLLQCCFSKIKISTGCAASGSCYADLRQSLLHSWGIHPRLDIWMIQ